MDLGIAGKRAAVAAGSAGLGLASAKSLADNGAHVVICGRDRAKLDAAAALIGHGCVALVADVSTGVGGAAFVEAAIAELGGIDILVANGGGPPPGNFASTPMDAYAAALERSLTSVVGMVTTAVPGMQERGWGRIVAITSLSVRQPMATLILSNTARAGVTGFLKTVATEIAPHGITVNSVQPGLHLTDRMKGLYPDGLPDVSTLGIPTGHMGDPADFGEAVAFLCSQQAKFITGSHIPIDGGANTGLL
jgi:3-oxoacyl-[acyl-carrier protein] reductase